MLFLKNGWLALSSLTEKFTANNLVKSRPIPALTLHKIVFNSDYAKLPPNKYGHRSHNM